jgi:hypothetical protein
MLYIHMHIHALFHRNDGAVSGLGVVLGETVEKEPLILLLVSVLLFLAVFTAASLSMFAMQTSNATMRRAHNWDTECG